MMFRKKTLLTCSEGQDWFTFHDPGVTVPHFSSGYLLIITHTLQVYNVQTTTK